MSDKVIRFQPKTKVEFKQAIDIYYKNKEEAIKRYGIMTDWDVSLITESSEAFKNQCLLKSGMPNGMILALL